LGKLRDAATALPMLMMDLLSTSGAPGLLESSFPLKVFPAHNASNGLGVEAREWNPETRPITFVTNKDEMSFILIRMRYVLCIVWVIHNSNEY
jgi:hypothetical protein